MSRKNGHRDGSGEMAHKNRAGRKRDAYIRAHTHARTQRTGRPALTMRAKIFILRARDTRTRTPAP